MHTARIEKLIWVLIFGGMLLLGLGLSVKRSDAVVGWPIAVVGTLAIVVGIVLIYVRSRMHEESE